ncbi:MAG: hypothetical protein AB3X44_20820 [Leptothrix sp. (in: b-proteobacteria)]
MHASQEAIRSRETSVTLKNRLRNHQRLWTALQGLRAILNKLIQVQRIYFFVHDVADQLHFHHTTTKNFHLVIGTPDIIERYRTDLVDQFGLSHQLIDERRDAGKEVLLAIKNIQVVSMLWLSFDAQPVAEIGMTLGLKSGEFLTFVTPERYLPGVATA